MNSIDIALFHRIKDLRECGCTHKPVLYTGDHYMLGCKVCKKILDTGINGILAKRYVDLYGIQGLSLI